MRVRFIVNPAAGDVADRDSVNPVLHQALSNTSHDYEICTTRRKGDARRMAAEAVICGYERVVAVGGDGTINEVAGSLVGTASCLGVVPLGSGNGFARGMGIPLDIRKACELVLKGKSATIDVGRIEDQFFFSTAGIGFDAFVGDQYDRKTNRYRGLWPYIYLTLKGAFLYKPDRTQVRIDRETLSVRPLLVTLANTGQYGGGAVIAPDARPDDGLLDVCVVDRMSSLEVWYHAPKLFVGRTKRIPQLRVYRAKTVEILRETSSLFQADGDPFYGGRRLRATVLPGALKVCASLAR